MHPEREILDRDENEDRIRTIEACTVCGLVWSGCFAKRLDDDGRRAWGEPGVWGYFNEKTIEDVLQRATPEEVRCARVEYENAMEVVLNAEEVRRVAFEAWHAISCRSGPESPWMVELRAKVGA